MKKELLILAEAIGQLDVRERFFIGAAIKDALVLGNRSALLTEDEATNLYDVVENCILSEARQHEEISAYLNSGAQSAGKHHQQDENSNGMED